MTFGSIYTSTFDYYYDYYFYLGAIMTIPSLSPAWDRLLRFIDDDGKVTYGNVQGSSTEEPLSELKVEILQGESIWNLTRTGKIVSPKTILGPLDASEVPIVRCIGLNYGTHSEFCICRCICDNSMLTVEAN
jgi:hypothetical protein